MYFRMRDQLTDIGVLSGAGINWVSINDMSEAGINWLDVDVMSDMGVNWVSRVI